MKARFFLFGASGYLLGSLLVGFERPNILAAGLLLVALAIALTVLVMWRIGMVVLIAVICGGLGWWGAGESRTWWQELPHEIEFHGEVLVVKREATKIFYQPITLRPTDASPLSATDILWRAPRTVQVTPGQYLSFDCVLKRPDTFDPQFDYRAYLATQNIGYLCDQAEAMTVLPRTHGWRTTLFHVQKTLREHMHTLLPDPAAGLLQGLFLGGDDALPKSVSDNFRRAGLSHVVAVSGYNMTLVAFAVLFLALFLGFWRKTATLLATLGVVAFLLLIDTSAASLRAALMTWTAFLAFFLGRPGSAVHGMLLAGLFMAWVNPLVVRYDAGFQLSFLATLALLMAGPWLAILYRRSGLHWKVLVVVISSMIVNLFLVPVLMFHFGVVSLLSPLANLMTLLIPLTMMFGFLMLLGGAIIPWLGTLLAFPTWFLLMLLVWGADWFGSMRWALFERPTPTVVEIVLWYIVLAFLVWYSRASLKRYVLRMDH